ncbi:MAG: hypothetical protein JXR78_06470, partial [Victivallales bacterium]|nr:hypothetical protein [Victivallales bacterium]
MNTLFRLEFPLWRTHLGMLMGNGNMGVLVWGEGTRVCLTVNRGDYWDHRQGERVLPGQSYRELVEAFDPYDVEPVNTRFVREERVLDKPGLWWPSSRLPVGRIELELSTAVEYVELDYASGCVSVKAGEACLRLILARHCQQLLIEDKNGLIAGIVPRPAWEWIGESMKQVGFSPPELWEEA